MFGRSNEDKSLIGTVSLNDYRPQYPLGANVTHQLCAEFASAVACGFCVRRWLFHHGEKRGHDLRAPVPDKGPTRGRQGADAHQAVNSYPGFALIVPRQAGLAFATPWPIAAACGWTSIGRSRALQAVNGGIPASASRCNQSCLSRLFHPCGGPPASGTRAAAAFPPARLRIPAGWKSPARSVQIEPVAARRICRMLHDSAGDANREQIVSLSARLAKLDTLQLGLLQCMDPDGRGEAEFWLLSARLALGEPARLWQRQVRLMAWLASELQPTQRAMGPHNPQHSLGATLRATRYPEDRLLRLLGCPAKDRWRCLDHLVRWIAARSDGHGVDCLALWQLQQPGGRAAERAIAGAYFAAPTPSGRRCGQPSWRITLGAAMARLTR
jgi:hypothetical protein